MEITRRSILLVKALDTGVKGLNTYLLPINIYVYTKPMPKKAKMRINFDKSDFWDQKYNEQNKKQVIQGTLASKINVG